MARKLSYNKCACRLHFSANVNKPNYCFNNKRTVKKYLSGPKMPQYVYNTENHKYYEKKRDKEEFRDSITCDGSGESIEELRARLSSMKKLMEMKNNGASDILRGERSASQTQYYKSCGFIDASFLAFIFTFILFVIITVSGYAFYNLFIAVQKKFSPRHDEL